MNLNRKLLTAGALTGVTALAFGMHSTAIAAAPEVTVQQEEAAHPQLVKAIYAMEQAVKELQAAPDDFGGNKTTAIQHTQAAIHSLKKALYYRLKMDDAAIDKMHH